MLAHYRKWPRTTPSRVAAQVLGSRPKDVPHYSCKVNLLSRHRRSSAANLTFLIVAGSAFGYIEAAVVYYLRALMNFHRNYSLIHYKTLLNLGFIEFVTTKHSLMVDNRITDVEKAREVATIVVLIAIAYVAGSDWRQRLGAFLVSFASWDIMYYVFLKILDNWPSSFFTKDVFFLIPVTWIGPVITPLVFAVVTAALGSRLYLRR